MQRLYRFDLLFQLYHYKINTGEHLHSIRRSIIDELGLVGEQNKLILITSKSVKWNKHYLTHK